MILDNQEIRQRLKTILNQMEIPFIHNFDCEACMDFIKNDKKANQDSISIIQVNTIGKAEIITVPFVYLTKYLRGAL